MINQNRGKGNRGISGQSELQQFRANGHWSKFRAIGIGAIWVMTYSWISSRCDMEFPGSALVTWRTRAFHHIMDVLWSNTIKWWHTGVSRVTYWDHRMCGDVMTWGFVLGIPRWFRNVRLTTAFAGPLCLWTNTAHGAKMHNDSHARRRPAM